MGLDTVELVMEIEDSFGISISDEESCKVVTVGDCYHVVLKLLGDKRGGNCLTAHAFYRIRKALQRKLGLPRSFFHPMQDMGSIIPKKQRKTILRDLSEELGWEFAGLHRPLWLRRVLFWLPVVSVAMASFGLLFSWTAVCVIIAVDVLVFHVTEPLARSFEPTNMSLGDFVKHLVQKNFHEIAATVKNWHESDVWNVIKGIIVDQLGVDPEEVKPDARFVGDLGC